MHYMNLFKVVRTSTKTVNNYPLGVDGTAEWCNSFLIAPKLNGSIHLCLDPTRLNHALIRPVQRGQTITDLFKKTYKCMFPTLIDANSGYHNLNLDKNVSYLTNFAC